MDHRITKILDGIREEFPEASPKEIVSLAMRISIPIFAVTCFPKSVPLKIPDVHYELYDLLEDDSIRKAAIALPRGMAKCVSGDTEILCADGTRKKISEIRSGEKIFSLNQKTLAFEEDSIAAKVYSGKKKAITITTKTMKEITCSPEHRILTYDGWKEASKITTSDRIASPRRTMFSDTAVSDYSDEEVRFLAYAVDPVEEWVRLENASVFWDSVISIVDNDESVDMYDIQVAKNENAIMNGLVAHNSTVTSFLYVLWRLLHKPSNKDLFITIISESQAQSINFLTRIKSALTKNKKIHSYFGDFGVNTALRWREDDIVLANGARVTALGTGQKVRGNIQDDTRPNVLILDDFESETNAKTAEARQNNRKWILEAVEPSLSQTEGRIIAIGTTISEDCFLQWVKDAPDWHVIWKSVIDENGKSIWPEMYPLEVIEQKRKSFEHMGNLSGFFQEYMNQPQSPDDAPFKPHYMKTYSGDLELVDGRWWLDWDGKKRLLNLFMGVDLASSSGLRSDYTVLATIGKDAFGNEFLIDVVRSKSNPADHPRMIVDQYEKWKHQGVYIESIAYQEACRQHVRAMAQDRGIHIPGIERKITHRTGKSERLISLVPLLAQGRFYFRSGDLDAQREFLAFPKGKNDDLLDAIWLASSFGYKPIQKDSSTGLSSALKGKIARRLGWMTA